MRKIELSDITDWMKLKNRVGWNQSKFELEFLSSHNLEHSWGIWEEGTMIASASAANYNNDFSCINMVIVDEPCRGRGLARQLLEKVMESLRDCRIVGLQATPAGMGLYEKLGFTAGVTLTKWTCRKFTPSAHVDLSQIKPLERNDLDEAAAFDEKISGMNRRDLLEAFQARFPEYAFQIRRNGRMTGFAMGRQGEVFRHITPLEAETLSDAEALLTAAALAADNPLIIDIPDCQAGFLTFAVAAGFEKQRVLTGMYLKTTYAMPGCDHYFATCGGEFF